MKIKKRYPCKLARDGYCEHGGNKKYNYGFVSGIAGFCRLSKKWVDDLKECPLKEVA